MRTVADDCYQWTKALSIRMHHPDTCRVSGGFGNAVVKNVLRGIIFPMRFWMNIVLALALMVAFPCAAFAEQTAVAEEAEPYVILDGKSDIEKATDARDEAQAESDKANEKAAALQEQIDEIEEALPAQQARSDAGMKQRYIMQSNPLIYVEALISVDSLGDFLRQIDYLEIASKSNLEELNRLVALRERLNAAHAEQEKVVAEAQAALDEAQAAYQSEVDKRVKAHDDGVAKAKREASKQGGKKSVGVAYDGGKQEKGFREAASEDTEDLDDGIDWTMSSEEFIAEWAPRIDAYLEGSALEGQGENFAAAAWKHNVDPRWSPAISNTESSKGAICIRPFNAWGWGAADSDPYGLAFEWGSWEEAIDAHVAGLADGFGYTISMNAAKKYCPTTWQSWYNKTLSQMAQMSEDVDNSEDF